MTRRFRLASVLRARQAQEDVARGEVARARGAAKIVADAERRTRDALDGRQVPDKDTARAVIAALVARQALAGEVAIARRLTRQAEQRVQGRIDELTVAAQRRRTVERLIERHVEQRRLREQHLDQAAIDELATTNRQRIAAREVGS